jgi:hypothetical protein
MNGNTPLKALVYAYDVVLIAETDRDMARMLDVFQEYSETKGLKINFSKSKVMRLGGRAANEGAWVIKSSRGGLEGILEEVTTFKYLGLQISRSAGWKLTEQSKLESLKKRDGMIKAKATCLPQKVAPAKLMWQAAAKAQWEYGLECIHTSATWQGKVDIIQNKMAKWLLGASPSASSTGAVGEIGWTPMALGVKWRKLQLWAKVQQMPNSRLPRQCVKMMGGGPYRCDWLEDIRSILQEYQLPESFFDKKGWQQQTMKQMREVEWGNWGRKASTKDRLAFYRKSNKHGPEPYLNESNWSKAFCQARIGDFSG